MDETSKTRNQLTEAEKAILTGKGIDIGCGSNPVFENVRRFDLGDGDANEVSRFVHEQFDFVYSSHCLEHMHDPRKTILDWWKLVKPGGHLFFMVPDEDIYEQGVFPSIFNPDHKATFTIHKSESWSRVSYNVRDLAESLPGGEVVSIVLQDVGYDYSLRGRHTYFYTHAPKIMTRVHGAVARRLLKYIPALKPKDIPWLPIDQTREPEVMAQIKCIVKKLA